MATVLESTVQAEQKVILLSVTWETYERLLNEHLATSNTRFTYDQGRLEIMVLSFEHETLKHNLALLFELLAGELEIDVVGAGSTTFRREDKAKGFEPDASFYLTNAERVRTLKQIDLTTDPPPELVIEIDISHPSLNKFPIFAALGVLEVWRCDAAAQVRFFRLSAGNYVAAEESAALPGVTGAFVSRLLAVSQTMKRTDWLRLVRESVKQPAKDE